ncbi:MAG: shikimate dehydrogenase [Sphaerochaetaceae bacterium]
MICLVLSGSTIEENLLQVERNRPYIDIVELRVDLLEESELNQAAAFPSLIDLPVILTCRRQSDGGSYQKSERSRLALLSTLLEGSFAYIDLEEDVKKSLAEAQAKEKGITIIRSLHNFETVIADIYHKIAKMAASGDIPKVAVTPRSVNDLITLFRVKEELASVPQKIVLGMGDFGFPSRILYKKMGSMLTYCADKPLAPGQITARMMKELYRADQVDERTHLYALIGNPVLHSFSPQIHNTGFHGIKYNAIYVPIPVDSVRSFFALAEMLKIVGFSVTVPLKQHVLPYLGQITREVKQIGSCNTVVRKRGLFSGINTDYYGFLRPLEHAIETQSIQSALVVGAGGAARAVVWALRNHGVKVTILNRSAQKAQQLANETMASYDSLEHAHRYTEVNLVVQTTSLGMEGEHMGVDPIPSFDFQPSHIVYELVYRPRVTALLKRAQKGGSTLIYGLQMLIGQGMLQFEAFTGYHYPKRLEQQLDLEKE